MKTVCLHMNINPQSTAHLLCFSSVRLCFGMVPLQIQPPQSLTFYSDEGLKAEHGRLFRQLDALDNKAIMCL